MDIITEIETKSSVTITPNVITSIEETAEEASESTTTTSPNRKLYYPAVFLASLNYNSDGLQSTLNSSRNVETGRSTLTIF